ncbi:MAG: PadR family transcriptional regulator [Cyanobacteria bacterium P01_G01_bin.39]
MSTKKMSFPLKISALEEDILTILSINELYGLQIRQALEKAYEGKRNITIGSLYPTLHRMEKKGYVESKWGEDKPSERNGARRKYYKISGIGEKVLKERRKVRDNLNSLEFSPA